jgi:hypothetical protein
MVARVRAVAGGPERAMTGERARAAAGRQACTATQAAAWEVNAHGRDSFLPTQKKYGLIFSSISLSSLTSMPCHFFRLSGGFFNTAKSSKRRHVHLAGDR